jgi:hypothetical protein
MKDSKNCPKCQFAMSEEPKPFPVILQTVFGLNFLAFWLAFDAIRPHRWAVWAWCLSEIILGFFLIRARVRARGRVYRCIRCDSTLG